MIVSVAVDPGLVEPLPQGSPARERVLHKRSLNALAERLYQHGCLIAASAEDGAALVAAARSLEASDPTTGRRWLDALAALKDAHRFVIASPQRTRLADATTAGPLRSEWKSHARIAVLRDEHAESLGIVDCDGSKPELAPLMVARDAKCFARLEGLAASGVWAHGESRDDFWSRVLRPLAIRSSQIAVCDRYMLRGMAEEAAGVRRGGAGVDALTWLLRRTDETAAAGSTVNLYLGLGERSKPRGVDVDGPATTADAAQLIRRFFVPGGGKVAAVNVHGVRWPRMDLHDRPHDRHISFDSGADIGLAKGLDSFDTDSVQPASGVAWAYLTSSAAQGKNASERRAVTRTGTVVPVGP